MKFDEYQNSAKFTAKMDLQSPEGRVELVLGLSSEAGSVANIYKKMVRDGVSLTTQRASLYEELGDVLWYVAMVAESMKISLSDVAEKNLLRIEDRHHAIVKNLSSDYPHTFDDQYPAQEQLPQRSLFHLQHVDGQNGMPHVRFTIEGASPNAFPDGDFVKDSTKFGFTYGKPIGSVVNDNSSQADGYRFHDAVHLAFMAVLGWSPVMRGLLRLKRKSDPEIDRVQDGARARDLEEALSAVLKAMSFSRNDFRSKEDIDDEVRDVIRRVVSGLEVTSVPIWLWVEAIHQGYSAMAQLQHNQGGWIIADRKLRQIKFHAIRPTFDD